MKTGRVLYNEGFLSKNEFWLHCKLQMMALYDKADQADNTSRLLKNGKNQFIWKQKRKQLGNNSLTAETHRTGISKLEAGHWKSRGENFESNGANS